MKVSRIFQFGALSVIGGLGLTMMLPKQSVPQTLLPIAHLLNVAKAGMEMTYVYKFSNKSLTQKHQQASGYLREALKKNGGIYIKLGQLIATLDVIVPDQYRDGMMDLTRCCQVSSFENVKQIIESETGKKITQIFEQFEQKPISSASIGQVHKAKLKTGETVAVKVQHENLAENVIYDLQLMRIFVNIGKFIFKEDFKYQWLLQQFEVNIQKQLDFKSQAKNMKRVKQMLIKEKLKNVYVPKLLREPTKKLLIMQFIHGFHVDEIEKMKMAKINMKQIGKTFSNVVTKMIHKYGFVHADPHSGNILVRKNEKGKDQLVLLDHGLYQQLDEITREDYNWFWLGLILNKQNISVNAANRLGTRNGILLCSMLTSQTRQQLKSPDRNIFDLNPGTDKTVIMKHAKQWHSQIVTLLNEIKRSILLLLKVNQFARTIQNMLGGRQMGVYHDIAFCCVDNLPISLWSRIKYKVQMTYQYVKR